MPLQYIVAWQQPEMLYNRGGVVEDVLGLEDTFWSPWALALKVKSLAVASRPPVLKNCPVLGSRTALFFELLKFCRSPEKKFYKTFFTVERMKNYFEDLLSGDRQKNFFKTFFFFFEIAWNISLKTVLFFFRRTLPLVSLVLGLEHFCPWPREGLSSEGLSLALDFFVSLALASDFFVSLALASSLLSSTPPLLYNTKQTGGLKASAMDVWFSLALFSSFNNQ